METEGDKFKIFHKEKIRRVEMCEIKRVCGSKECSGEHKATGKYDRGFFEHQCDKCELYFFYTKTYPLTDWVPIEDWKDNEFEVK